MPDRAIWTPDAPLVIAHRGASLIAPENTMAAFNLAYSLGADAIELDVKLSRDRAVVVHHDARVDRTTDGSGRVKDLKLGDLQLLDAGSSFSPSFAGERIPELHALLAALKDSILMNIELTNYNDPFDDLPEAVCSILGKARLSETILISSFNPVALRKVRRLSPELRTALLIGPREVGPLRGLMGKFAPHHDLHPHHRLISQDLIRTTHEANGRINVWTVNQPHQMVELFVQGVDGIITDDVESALKARRDAFTS